MSRAGRGEGLKQEKWWIARKQPSTEIPWEVGSKSPDRCGNGLSGGETNMVAVDLKLQSVSLSECFPPIHDPAQGLMLLLTEPIQCYQESYLLQFYRWGLTPKFISFCPTSLQKGIFPTPGRVPTCSVSLAGGSSVFSHCRWMVVISSAVVGT